MMKKDNKEWYFNAPWGKVALVSWGDPNGPPVLLVHGKRDSLSTFIPLLEYLPDNYNYVGFDLPGHGNSDPFPIGLSLVRLHYLAAIDLTIQHLKWSQFVYIGHSMGSEQGLFYNAVYPNRITKLVLLDPIQSFQKILVRDPQEYYKLFYANYYDNYTKYNNDERVYTKRRALDAVMKARGLSEEEAEIVLQRNMKCIGHDQYKLSWDHRLRELASLHEPPLYYSQIFTKNPVPILTLTATNIAGYVKARKESEEIMEYMKKTLLHCYEEIVVGNHDIHLCKPAEVANHINVFLNTNFKAKI